MNQGSTLSTVSGAGALLPRATSRIVSSATILRRLMLQPRLELVELQSASDSRFKMTGTSVRLPGRIQIQSVLLGK